MDWKLRRRAPKVLYCPENLLVISAEEIAAFAKLYPHDVRPVQPLNGRVEKKAIDGAPNLKIYCPGFGPGGTQPPAPLFVHASNGLFVYIPHGRCFAAD